MKTRKFARLLSAGLSVAALSAVPAAAAHAAPSPDPNQTNDSANLQNCRTNDNNDYYSNSGLIGINLALKNIELLNGVGILGSGTYTENTQNQTDCKMANATNQQNQKQKEQGQQP
jgi:hypothetical protein